MQDIIWPGTTERLIDGVVIHPLKVNADPRGSLVEMMRVDWSDLYHGESRPFTQTYYSVTKPGVARDEDRWHVHETQEDRFLVPQGDAVLAIYDGRANSPTRGILNLIPLGEALGPTGQRVVLVPIATLHAFVVVGDRPATLINFPTRLYNPADEGRLPFTEAGATFADGRPFHWDVVRSHWSGLLSGTASPT